MLKRCWLLFLIACGMLAVLAPSASAGAPAPGWEVIGTFDPTYLEPGGTGVLHLFVYDTGALPAEGEGPVLTDTLPEGLEAEATEGCTGTKVITCRPGVIEPSPIPAELVIPLRVRADAHNPSPEDAVTVSGGGAMGPADAHIPVVYGSSPAPVGFAKTDLWITNADGTADQQAGSHPYELTFAFAPNVYNAGGFERPTGGEAQALNVNLPPGLVGEPNAVPKCSRRQFDAGGEDEERCPSDTEIGEDHALIAGAGAEHLPIYNLVPPPGVAAEFGFDFNGTHAFLDARVRSGGDYGITEHANVPQLKVQFNTATIWGTPGEHGTGAPLKPFLTLPTSCGRPLDFGVEMLGTWQEPGVEIPPASFQWHNNKGEPIEMTGCEKLAHFEPSIQLAPDTSSADTPAGLSATVRVPQGLNPEGLATSGLEATKVVLPPGIAINPGQATGLVACQPSQEQIGGPEAEKEVEDGPAECPAASQIGEDEFVTPLLSKSLKGAIYVLQSNPPNVEILLTASGEGVNIKLVGNVQLNESTGQVTTTVDNTPDFPVSEAKVDFNGGAQAALVTPSLCGVYRALAAFTPWAAPAVLDTVVESNFQITRGPIDAEGGSCTAPLPFSPSLTAGSSTDQAGGYTDFSTLLSRADGQQRINSLQFETPEGLSGMIAKVPLCEEPRAASGDCSEASQIGHTAVGSGPGPYPLVIPEAGQPAAPIYLTGPYEGAPFGLSIKVPVIAGPFNLGNVIVRGRIEVDPYTAQVKVTTDALPTIIKGVPTDLRWIDAVIDRPGFMFNPTNCGPMSFSGVATSTEGASAPLESHFQVGSCRALKFKPSFTVSTSGKTSRINGASLDAKVRYPTSEPGTSQATSQANIARVRVELPKRLPSRLTTLQKACPAKVFEANPAGCPAASIVGHATAVTPVLPVPVVGPAYFVSHGNEAFPSLILVLQGDNVTIDLVGTTFISKKGVTSSTFKQVPDVPVSSFELQLPEGPHSALAANGNLCQGSLAIPTEFVGQNGATIKQNTKLNVTGCKKKKSKKKAKAKSKKAKK